MNRRCHCQIIPPFMLEHIAATQHAAAQDTLHRDHQLRATRETLDPAANSARALRCRMERAHVQQRDDAAG